MLSTEQCFTVQRPLGVECIQPIKIDLDQRGLLDTVLKSNLDFAMKAFESMSIGKKKDALLQIEGEKKLLRITAGQPVFHHTVWNDNGSLKLLQKINVQAKNLTKADIDSSHFLGHCCRDEVESCMKQALKKVASEEGLENVELKIMCGELHLTYVTQDPSTTILIKPNWRVNVDYYVLESFLRVKHHMEKAGEMSAGMMACFQLLLTCPKVEKKCHCKLLLSEDKKVEFEYSKYEKPFTIVFDTDHGQAKMLHMTDFSNFS